MKRTGKCLCGDVSFEAEPFGSMQACHCGTCRKWGGGPWMALSCKSASIYGPVTRYRSSDAADRGFCPTCGTHIFFYAREPRIYAIPAGLFDDVTDLPFKAEYFVDEKPDHYVFAGDRKLLTGAEFEAQFRQPKET